MSTEKQMCNKRTTDKKYSCILMEICLVWKCNHTNNLTAGKQMILLQTPPTSTLKQVFIDYSEKASESGLDSRVYFTHCPSLCVVSVMTDGHV